MSTVTAPRPTPSAAAPRRGTKKGKRRLGGIIPLLLMLAGVAVLLYPVMATQYNNYKQREFSAQYNTNVQAASPDTLAAERKKAAAYNATLTGVPILDPYLSGLSTTERSESYDKYLATLGSFDAMARIRVPTGSIDLPVYHGTSDETIAKGAGHLYGTSLPVGGVGTHAVLTSHTGMSNATLFDHLIDVKKGDMMYVDTYGETLAYEVDDIQIVLPTQIDALHAVKGKDLLTLFTCTPYAVNTHRLLVTGHRVPYDAATAPAPDVPLAGIKLEAWMWALIGAAAVALLLLIFIIVRELRGSRRAPVPPRAMRGVAAGKGDKRRPAGGPARHGLPPKDTTGT